MRWWKAWAAVAAVAAVVAVAAWLVGLRLSVEEKVQLTVVAASPEPVSSSPTPTPTLPVATPTPPPPTPVPTPTPYGGWVDPASEGLPYGSVPGLLTFRGNPTRTFYGTGPAPQAPQILWRFTGAPERDLCSLTSWELGVTEWCGTGWTGQPAVFEREGQTWVVVGSFAPAVHFLDADTGERLRPDFVVDDLIKGSVTVDPDGYPLVYFGSRDNFFRIVAFDRDEPEEVWSLNAYEVSPVRWNNDWDGAALVLDDYLFQGGENSHIHIVKLNRGYGPDGRVTIDPELVFNAPGWDDELLSAVGDGNVSIETGVTVVGNTLYFANSGGLIQGWDISGLAEGRDPVRVFRYWAGDDVDATVVAGADGYLYAGVEFERDTERSKEVGQIIKLDPAASEPRLWGVDSRVNQVDGVWATPALTESMVYVPVTGGKLLGISRDTGEVVWTKFVTAPVWSSPVVIDDVLIQPDCAGVIRAFDISDPAVDPPELWRISLPNCVESTVAVWEGVMYVGARNGGFYAIGDQ